MTKPPDDPRERLDVEDTKVLLPLARQGDPCALSKLLERYQTRVLRRVRRRLGPGLRAYLDSGDVIQEVMVETIRSIEESAPEDERAFFRWLCGVTENKLRNLARQRDRHAARLPGAELFDGLAAREGSRGRSLDEERALLEEALVTLRADHRRVIRLRDYEALSFRDIGERLERTPEAACALYARAQAALAQKTLYLRSERGLGE